MENKSYLEELEGIPFDATTLNYTTNLQSVRDLDLDPFSDKISTYLRMLNTSSDVSIQLNRPLLWYIRSAETLYKQAAIYRREGDLEKAYVLFMKFSILVLREMPKHSQYKLAEYTSLTSTLKALCVGALDYLEKLKNELRNQYSKKYREFISTETDVGRKIQGQIVDTNISSSKTSWMQRQKEIEKFNNEHVQVREKHSGTSGVLVDPVVQQLSMTPISTPEAINQKLREASERYLSTVQSELEEPAFPSVTNSWFSENGNVLREVRIPQSIVEDFLGIAQTNTNRNLETCGIVAGNLKSDIFTVSTLIVPKQTATSDTCAMLHEEEVLECQDREDLITIGWIHTHPTQACFLSSVDVHTQFPFQLLLAEAIAIVCAPTQTPNYGVFRLTDPPGMDIISKCKNPAPFHPHPPGASIYKEISGPENGHITLDKSLPLKMIDLRNTDAQ